MNNTLYFFGVYKIINNAWSICPATLYEARGDLFSHVNTIETETQRFVQGNQVVFSRFETDTNYQLRFTFYVLGSILNASH